MTAPPPIAVAPNFHLPGGLAERVLPAGVAGGGAVPEDDPVLLFALPGHLCASLWRMVEQEAGDFDAFAAEVGRFLTFKQLPPPAGAMVDLVLHAAGGTIDSRDLWAVVNLGDDALLVGLPGLSLRLAAGEGCRLPATVTAEVQPPAGELPVMLLLLRHPGVRPEEPGDE